MRTPRPADLCIRIVILTSFAHHIKLLPCQGEVARSAETEGFRGHLSQGGKIAEALQRTLPSRFAIHLPLAGKELIYCKLHTPLASGP